MKKIINFLLSLALISFFIVPLIVSAQEGTSSSMLGRLKDVSAGGGYVTDESTASISTIVGSVISVALSFLGIIFIILIIYSGYNWMTAGGNEEQIKKSTKTITRAIIGLVITLSSWAIWFFILQNLINID